MNQAKKQCPCESEKMYEECCGRFHRGSVPSNAQELMRSRYVAYVLNLPDYIIATTHPGSPYYQDNRTTWKRNLAQFSERSTFHKLEILDFQENGDSAMVVFVAYLSQGEEEATFTEKSYFQKVKGKWLYLRGESAKGRVPELVTKHPFQLLSLAYYGQQVLRDKAASIVEITDEIKELVNKMIETMHTSAGIGLAAPQIHHSLRLFVIQAPVETRDGKFEPGEIQVFINPKLSEPSVEKRDMEEGCLSIPGVRANVQRPAEIMVEYTTLEGKTVKKRVSGWEARVIMHENDHINGVLFIDRLDHKKRAEIDLQLNHLKNRLKEIS
ncbi:MAG: peptide deformylase [Parachlamydiaceae bacterium]